MLISSEKECLNKNGVIDGWAISCQGSALQRLKINSHICLNHFLYPLCGRIRTILD